MFCVNCGQKIKENENFCANCGFQIFSNSEKPLEKEAKEEKKKNELSDKKLFTITDSILLNGSLILVTVSFTIVVIDNITHNFIDIPFLVAGLIGFTVYLIKLGKLRKVKTKKEYDKFIRNASIFFIALLLLNLLGSGLLF
jgi:Na+/H+ antiporter NhaD/arsenite permease-like protein